jgi:carnitine-CoA ligase
VEHHLDARMPRPEQCVQRYMIERWAREQPQKIFAVFPDGEQWTYAETEQIAIKTANALKALGVQQGERVVVWLPNNADCLRVWFGLNFIGAVFVPINTAYRGAILEHAIRLSEARLMIAHAPRST